MLEVDRLCKGYVDGDRRIDVLDGVSFVVDAGTSLAVTGPSGSGKSTLLNVLAGILACDGGKVTLDTGTGSAALHLLDTRARTRLRRRHIGYVHQFFNLIPTLTVLENVQLPGELNRIKDAPVRALGLLDSFGLAHRKDVFPGVLSGGEQQRVAVARALLIRPALLLADEPTGNLDARNTELVSSVLFDAAKAHGAVLVVATHSDRVAARADRRLHLDGGVLS